MSGIRNEITLHTEIEKWNPEKSIKEMQVKVKNWKNLTAEIMREIYIAHKYFTSREKCEDDECSGITWQAYCNAVGLSKTTAYNWLKRFTPAELSATGADVFRTAEEQKELLRLEKETQAQGRAERIRIYQETGNFPEGWTNDDYIELCRIKQIEDAREAARFWSEMETRQTTPRRDYFQEILKMTDSKQTRRFALQTKEQQIMQERAFTALERYLTQFQDLKTRLEATVNLAEKLKQTINIYYEEMLLQQELNPESGAEGDLL